MENKEKMIPSMEIADEFAALKSNGITSDKKSVIHIKELENKYDFSNKTFTENGKMGVKDCQGNILVPAEFESIETLWSYRCRHNAVVISKNGRYGVVSADGTGKVVAKAEYTDYQLVTGPFWALKNAEGKWGLVDFEGTVCIPFEQDSIDGDCCNNYVFFERNGKIGVYAYEWDVLTDAIFDEITEVGVGEYLGVKVDGRNGKVTCEGKFIADEDYKKLSDGEQDDLNLIFCDAD